MGLWAHPVVVVAVCHSPRLFFLRRIVRSLFSRCTRTREMSLALRLRFLTALEACSIQTAFPAPTSPLDETQFSSQGTPRMKNGPRKRWARCSSSWTRTREDRYTLDVNHGPDGSVVIGVRTRDLRSSFTASICSPEGVPMAESNRG